MLKTIVKDEAICAEMFNRHLAGSGAICVANDGSNSFEIFCQEKGFIAGLTRRGKHGLSIRYEDATVWIGAPIAACKYANRFPFSNKRSRDPFDQRSFTGSSGCNVSYTNHWTFESDGTKCTSAIERQPCSCDSAIQRTQRGQYDRRQRSHDVRASEASKGFN